MKTEGKDKPLKVTLVCHSDLLGGASVVTYRLMNALRDEGVEARMVVYTRISNDDNVSLISTRYKRGVKFILERARIFLANGFSRDKLFKVSIANTGTSLHRHPWVREADVVVLSWVNQGLMSLKGLKRLGALGKPIFWTMHDMWCCTGICHHAYECRGYIDSCGRCPFLTGKIGNDLSRKVLRRKKKVYDRMDITFMPVSNWLARKCRESTLLKNQKIEVIHNAFPIDTFPTRSNVKVTSYDIEYDSELILFGAARIDDPIKGLKYTIDALNYIFDNYPEVANKSMAVFFGDLRDRSLLDGLRFPYRWIGRVNDPKALRLLYARANVVVSTSLYETLPGTLIEGQAAGCYPVSFGMGGQDDIIEHKKNGFIAEYKNPESVAEGIMWALRQPDRREELHRGVEERFSSRTIARKYIAAFQRALGNP